jgi:hypothetical protein
LAPGLAVLKLGQGVRPHRDLDPLDVIGERLEAVVGEVLCLAYQDAMQPRAGL